jgi:S-adenosylmethionine synthetase
VLVDTFGTAKVDEDKISEFVYKNIDLRPSAIIEKFDLRRPIYRQIAAYGHVGRDDLDLPWEKTDIADTIKAQLL